MTSRRRSMCWLARSPRSGVLSSCAAGWVAALLGGAMALGCGSNGGGDEDDEPAPPGGQTGEETLGCQPVARDMLAWSERSTLGFSADEMLNTLGAESSDRLAWSAGGSTPLTLGIARAASGSVEFQTREYVSDGSGAEIAAECSDVVAIPVVLSFATLDGAFAEQWPLTLLAESPTRVSAYTQVDVDELDGTFTVTQVDPSRFDRVLAIFQLTFADGRWTGTLTGQGIMSGSSNPGSTNPDSPSSDSATSANHFSIASF